EVVWIEDCVPLEVIVEVTERKLVVFRERMIASSRELLKILLVRSRKTCTVIRIANRNMLEQLDHSRIRCAGPLRRVRYTCRVPRKHVALYCLLITSEKECAVPDDWPTDCSAELIAL